MDEALNDILRAADRHPNSRVSKLIREVEDEPSQKNIVMLLIELSDHAEYATDFNISLRYYLDMYEKLGINRDLLLNEAGLMLVNSSKIYAKRVDNVQDLVERQIMTLSNADNEIHSQKEQSEQQSVKETNPIPGEKPKRGRKRALDAPTDPYEVQLEPKKFKKMSHEKRFSPLKTPTKVKPLYRNIEVEQQIHPACWKYAIIYDLENEEDVDTKRNYKLFTYHIEHRYNTLVPDINFRLHFKVKDYMDAQEEEMLNIEDATSTNNDHNAWPSHSEEYVRKYISLENRVLQQEIDPTKPYVSPKRNKTFLKIGEGLRMNNGGEMDETITVDTSKKNNTSMLHITEVNTSAADTSLTANDTSLGSSLCDNSLDISTEGNDLTIQQNSTICSSQSIIEENGPQENSINNNTVLDETALAIATNTSMDCSQTQPENDSGLGESLLDQTNNSNDTIMDSSLTLGQKDYEGNEYTELNETVSKKSGEIKSLENKEVEDISKKAILVNTAHSQSNSIEETNNSESLGIKKLNQGCNAVEDSNSMDAPTKEKPENSEQNSKMQDEPPKDNTENSEANSNINNITTNDITENVEEVKTNSESFQVEIEVVNEDGKAESNTIQIQIPSATDDEGCHLSDTYEDDFRLLSPTINVPNIMPGIERKDVTIYLDKELREALELRDNMLHHFSQETYKVPVIVEPKEYPLIFNILQLPHKVLKRKCLFKLGPEMDLYVKARTQKPIKPQKEQRSTRQYQFYPLNNTDMSGILETPPHSPGNASVFLGFTDDDDSHADSDETTCAEFFGFTEDEQNQQLSNHRLSRDSGVGVDVATLTPEKEPTLDVIFEEATTCAVDLGKAFEQNKSSNENMEDLLNGLSSSIRNVLEAEVQGDNVGNIVASDDHQCNENRTSETQIKANENEENGHTYLKENDISKDSPKSLNVKENEPNKEKVSDLTNQGNNEKNTTTESEYISFNKEDTITEKENEKSSAVEKPSEISVDLGMSISHENPEEIENDPVENALENSSSLKNQSLFDLDEQGEKTKIQQWHEHLRPILAKSRERHHFDVFQLGTDILKTIQSEDQIVNTGSNETISASFDDIMENKDRSYVSRYFLSTLLLANQSNINIMVDNKTSESPSSWSDIKLKLLSTKRHTVAIEDNIGMINERKRKNSKDTTTEENRSKKKKKSSVVEQESLDCNTIDSESDEPLICLQNSQTATKRSFPLKRNSEDANVNRLPASMNCEVDRHILQLNSSFIPLVCQQPSSKNSDQTLNKIRVLQPIPKLKHPPGDDLDSDKLDDKIKQVCYHCNKTNPIFTTCYWRKIKKIKNACRSIFLEM